MATKKISIPSTVLKKFNSGEVPMNSIILFRCPFNFNEIHLDNTTEFTVVT